MNMEKQVSGLYSIGDSHDKRKTLEITKVMKGALSVSKSRTGETIFRSNEFHRKTMEKKVNQYRSAALTEISSFEAKKRTITQRFSTVFGKHKATNETMHAYDEVITKALEDTNEKPPVSIVKINYTKNHESENEDDDEKKEDEVDGNKDGVKLPHVSNSQGRVKNVQNALDESERKKSVFIPTGVLMPISSTVKYSRLKFNDEKVEEEPEVVVEEVKELWPLENSTKYDKYIRTQKDRHEVLVTRNILKKIKSNISGKNTLLRFKMKAILTDDPEDFVRNLTTSAKTAPGGNAMKRTNNSSRKFKKFIANLPAQNTRPQAPSYASLQTSRLFPPITAGSVKSTSTCVSLRRSKTMPI